MTITLTGVTAVLGAVFGTAGVVLGLMNYLRDRPRIKIFLQWNMQMIPASKAEANCGMVTVTNTGRRTVYISHVCLVLPKTHKNRVLLLMDSVPGKKLSEGDPPAVFIIKQDIQNEYSQELKRIRAQVQDSTGQIYSSKYSKK